MKSSRRERPPPASRCGRSSRRRRCTKSFATLGFRSIEDLGPNEIAARFFPERAAPSRENGGHFALAGTL